MMLGTNAWGAADDQLDVDQLDVEDDGQEEFALADATLPPEETCSRIEALAVEHVRGVLNLYPLGSRGANRTTPAEGPWQEDGGRRGGNGEINNDHVIAGQLGDRGGEARGGDGGASDRNPSSASLEFTMAAGRQGAVLSSNTTDLAGYRVPISATTRVRGVGYVRVWRVLNALHAHLFERRTVTQRALYYLLASRDPVLFPAPAVVNSTLRECVSLLNCSRHAMVWLVFSAFSLLSTSRSNRNFI